jgi:hypothetical protein
LRDRAPVQTSQSHRMVALRTEPMTMTAFQMDGVDLGGEVPDAIFPQMLRESREGGLPSGRFRYDPLLTLRGPEGAQNEATLRRIVAEITGGASLSAAEFAARASAWLRERHAYSLSVRVPPGSGRDDIVRWLDSNEPGFCEYFAAGFTVLARAAGHPARVVAGFHGGALNAFENYFMVKNSEAHAWAEIHDGMQTWLRVDPTPGNTGALQGGAAAGQDLADSSWSARMDTLRVFWYRRIVNFDSRQQVEMIEQVKSFTSDSGASLRQRLDAFARELKAWLARPWDTGRIVRLAAQAAGAVAALWLLVRLVALLRARWRSRGQLGGYDPVRHEAGRQLARLRELSGRRTSHSEGRATGPGLAAPRQAQGLERVETAANIGEGGDNLAGVVGDLRRLRYGRRETWPEPRGVFKRARQARRAASRG